MKHGIRRLPTLWRATRLARRWYHARFGAYPDWQVQLAADSALWQSARGCSEGRPPRADGDLHRFVCARHHARERGCRGADLQRRRSPRAALRRRHDRVRRVRSVSLCRTSRRSSSTDRQSGSVPRLHVAGRARVRAARAEGPSLQRLADAGGSRGGPTHRGVAQPFDRIRSSHVDGLAIGEHAHAGALRFFATGSLEAEPAAEPVLRRYLESALLTAFASRRLMRGVGFSSAVLTHGIYVPWGIVGEVARQEGVHVSTWNVAYRKRRFIFSHDDTYHHTLMTRAARSLGAHAAVAGAGSRAHEVSREPPGRAVRLDRLSPSPPPGSRGHRATDWPRSRRSRSSACSRTSPGTRSFTIRPMRFRTWSSGWCRRASTSPRDRDLQLLIRVHPAEISGFPPSRQPILDELRKRVPELAPNIIVVPPESDMSTYALMSLCNAAIIYGTKMGVELTSVGLAGDRRGRGVDSEQGADARCQLAGRVLPDSSEAAVPGAAGRQRSLRAPGSTPTTSSSIA